MSRYRERGDLTSGSYRTQDWDPPPPNGSGGTPGPVTVSFPTKVAGSLETILDTSTPGFSKLRAKGSVIMSPVVQTFDKRTSTPSNWSFGTHPLWGRRAISGDCCAFLASSHAASPPDWSEKLSIARDEAVVMAHSRIADVTTQGLVSVAEAKKTAAMLRSPFQRSRDLVSDMVGRRLRYLKKGMKYAEASLNAYLEVRFGFQPFLYEMAATAKAYNTARPTGTTRYVARGSRKFTSEMRDTIATSFPGTTSVQLNRDCSWEAKVAAGVLYELTEDMDAARARAYGLRLVDLPSALYELVPFSFVLDRYLRAGDWLNAIIPKPGVSVKGGWVTTTTKQTNNFTVGQVACHVNNDPPTTYRSSGGSYNEVIRYKSRSVDFGLPTLPPINTGEHSLVQLVDEIALTAQVFKTFDVKNLRRWETYAPKKRWISLYRRHPTL